VSSGNYFVYGSALFVASCYQATLDGIITFLLEKEVGLEDPVTSFLGQFLWLDGFKIVTAKESGDSLEGSSVPRS
jgi:hypothetical protein